MTDPVGLTPLDRAVKRERERKARQRRAARLDAMRSAALALERAAPVVLTLHDNDDHVAWDGFLDADAMRMRWLMRRSLALAKEAQELQASQRKLQHLLREHQLASRVLYGLLGANPMNDWEADTLRWRQLTRKHFRPWTLEDYTAEIDDAVKEINALLYHPDAKSTSASFHGWRDRRVVDSVKQSLKFVFYKDFRGYDMMGFIHGLWMVYTDDAMCQTAVLGDLARNSVQIVQQLSPTMCIVRSAERYPTFDAHLLFLVFRVESEGSFTQCVRPIHAPELQAAIDGPNDVWVTNNIWFKWEPLRDDLQDFRLHVGGHIPSTDMKSANRWLIEVLVSLVSAEALITQRPAFKITYPTLDDGLEPMAPSSTASASSASALASP